jgi:hypothetical protein
MNITSFAIMPGYKSITKTFDLTTLELKGRLSHKLSTICMVLAKHEGNGSYFSIETGIFKNLIHRELNSVISGYLKIHIFQGLIPK